VHPLIFFQRSGPESERDAAVAADNHTPYPLASAKTVPFVGGRRTGRG
jgi:hypothetical protein